MDMNLMLTMLPDTMISGSELDVSLLSTKSTN